VTDEPRLTQAEKDEAESFARRAAQAGVPRPLVQPAHPEAHTLFDVQEMELNFGPQHPSTHVELRLVL
jgi:hypothetical protein